MDALVNPDLAVLRDWMNQKKIEWFECGECQSLHLSSMQHIAGVADARLDILDGTLLMTLSAEIRPSALLALVGDLSQINASSLTVKAFIDIQEESPTKLVLCQALSIGVGLTLSQFAFFMQQGEEQLTMMVMELVAGHLLVTGEPDAAATDTTPVLH